MPGCSILNTIQVPWTISGSASNSNRSSSMEERRHFALLRIFPCLTRGNLGGYLQCQLRLIPTRARSLFSFSHKNTYGYTCSIGTGPPCPPVPRGKRHRPHAKGFVEDFWLQRNYVRGVAWQALDQQDSSQQATAPLG